MRSQVPKFSLLLCWCYLLNVHLANANGLCIDKERDALLKFKAGFSEDYCGLLSSWNHHDCCQWDGVHCSNHTGHVIKLILRRDGFYINYGYNCLIGDLSSSLVDLKQLRFLDLGINDDFSYQPFPSFIGSLSKLEYLNLSNSYFQGDIPHQLGNLSHLTVLDLSFHYYITPGDLSWLSRLTFLRHINLSGVDLSKATNWLKIVNNLPFLRVLRLDSCLLEIVPRPLSYINSSTTLSVLSLAQNGLNDSSIFQWLFNLSGINTHLTHIDLSENQIQGPLPTSFGYLQALSYLNLSFNNLDSTIPTSFGYFQALSYLDLSNNNLDGTVPTSFGYLTALSYLDLSHNNFDGTVPTSFGYLTALSYLDLSHNNFNGTVPTSFGYLHALSYLDLTHNNLDGTVPTGFGYLQALSYLDLSHNNLDGTVQPSFGYLQALSYLDLSNNNLDGIVPTSFGKLQSLSFLSLSNNQFHGQIPNVGNSKNLTILDLSSNKFQVWPKTFSLMCSLEKLHLNFNNLTQELSTIIQTGFGCVNYSLSYLELSNNQIWGSVPSNIVAFSSLSWLGLGSNRLNGTVSISLGQLSMLKSLNLSSNSLKGSLFTNHFSNLSELRDLDLSYNPELKFEANPSSQLDTIRLRSCKLGPSFPKWLLAQKNYFELDISSAGISDRVPKSFWNSLPELDSLNMSHNNIYGTLPDLHLKSPDLEFHDHIQVYGFLKIDLSYNSFEGTLPSLFTKKGTSFLLNDNKFSDPSFFLCPKNMSNLSILDLSNNLLSGELPDCWMRFRQLIILRLSNNNISGAIPASIGYLEHLKLLHLSNNSFSGQVPRSFGYLTSLVVLDLAYNSLSGLILSTIGNNLESLSILSLRNNHFVGRIPSSLCELSSLQILDFSNNHITGSIPKCLYNIAAMKNGTNNNLLPKVQYTIVGNSFIFSFENYTEVATIMWKREESTFIKSLGLVKEIDMSNNELQGEIPDEIFLLTGLVSLDLSNNTLSGTITTKVGQLTELEFLDLSHNHLSGEIPESLAKLNSLGILDLSYNNLSGEIPTGTLLQGFDTLAYEGNPNLCGMPLPKCPWDHPTPDLNALDHDNDENESQGIYHLGLYISLVLGFIIGFWGVCGSLVLKRSWRHTFFKYFDDLGTRCMSYFL